MKAVKYIKYESNSFNRSLLWHEGDHVLKAYFMCACHRNFSCDLFYVSHKLKIVDFNAGIKLF